MNIQARLLIFLALIIRQEGSLIQSWRLCGSGLYSQFLRQLRVVQNGEGQDCNRRVLIHASTDHFHNNEFIRSGDSSFNLCIVFSFNMFISS